MSKIFFKSITLVKIKRALKEVQDAKKEVSAIEREMDQIQAKVNQLSELEGFFDDFFERISKGDNVPKNGEEAKTRIDTANTIFNEIYSTKQDLESTLQDLQLKSEGIISFDSEDDLEWARFLQFLLEHNDDECMHVYLDYVKNVGKHHKEDQLVIPPKVFFQLHHFGGCATEITVELSM